MTRKRFKNCIQQELQRELFIALAKKGKIQSGSDLCKYGICAVHIGCVKKNKG